MSPKKQIELNKLRNKLDKLDDSFIKLIKKRTDLIIYIYNWKKYQIRA